MLNRLRDWMNANPIPAAVIAGLLLVVSLYVVFRILGGGGGAAISTTRYYYDTAKGELFLAEARGVFPPFQNDEGNEAVSAYVYTCSECTPEKWFIAYLEKYTPDALKALQDLEALNEAGATLDNVDTSSEDAEKIAKLNEVVLNGRLVSQDEGKTWVNAATEQGEQIMGRKRLIDRCKEEKGRLQFCRGE